jgi:hypothetical protein
LRPACSTQQDPVSKQNKTTPSLTKPNITEEGRRQVPGKETFVEEKLKGERGYCFTK